MKIWKTLATATLGAAILASSTLATAAQVVRIGHGTSESFHLHRSLVEFKRLIEERSDGRYEIKIFPQSQMGPDREMIEATQSGMLQMAVPPSSILANWDQSFDVIELPFIYPNKETAFKVVQGPAGQNLLKRLQNLNLVGLGFMESGVRNITNSTRPINTVEDLKGIKLRTMKVPSHMDTFNALGASATPMNFGEVYSALQQGVIDGQENPLAIISSQRFYEVQKYMSMTNHVVTFYLPVFNMEYWMGLSAEDQAMFKTAIADALAYQQDLIAGEEGAQIEAMKKAGLKINTPTPENMIEFREKTESVRTKYREKIGAEIYDNWIKAASAAS